MSRIVLLDSEAVQALDPAHPKHRRALSHVQVVTQRKRRAVKIRIAVPTAVRVQAGWDRTAAAWAFANRLRISDEILDSRQANNGADIRHKLGVSVADAHLGAAIRSNEGEPITVITSDPGDVRTVAETRAVTVVAL